MKHRLTFAVVVALAVYGAGGPTPAATSSAGMESIASLSGAYTCTESRSGSTFTETMTRPFGNDVVRATDTENGKVVAEHTVGFDRTTNRWRAVSFYGGHYDAMTTGGASLGGPLTGKLADGSSQTLRFKNMPPSRYEVDIEGTENGKPFSEIDRCRK